MRMPSEYKTSSMANPQFDYALIKLKRTVQRDQYIKLGLGAEHLKGSELGIFGYR